MFTYHYAQPDFYHFSLDSIHLAQYVSKRIAHRPNLDTLRVLDLCAGCGVIGLELSWHAPLLRCIDFIEIQDQFTPYFQQNVLIVNRKELRLNWFTLNYDVLQQQEWQHKYDLIISNPPYFHPQHGLLSHSMKKNRCRFFLDSTFERYISAIVNALADSGEAYILLRPLQMHGIDAYSNLKTYLIDTAVSATRLTSIRGTDVILLNKNYLHHESSYLE